jgi:aspartyl-tRNA(Asn)/glutamyl-tRNA(Gln) amidotransferase subunit A
MAELWQLSAVQLVNRIAAMEVKPSEAMAAVLHRIELLNPRLNAFCAVRGDEAMAEARRADERIARGTVSGPLFGVPVSIKDLVFTQGLPTTFGSRMHQAFVPQEDELVVQRLKAAGAIILGKTTTCEFGYKAVTDSILWGITRNPWDLSKTPGGSSGGAAAAVAAGMGPLAVGSDGGGSIRVPAGFCGVFGFKPSRGRIPIHPLLAGWETVDRRVAHLGPVTRTVADAAIMLSVTAGPDDRDQLSLGLPREDFLEAIKGGVQGLRMAWSPDLGYVRVDPWVAEAVASAARQFETVGARVEEVRLELEPMHEAYQTLFAADCAGAIGHRLEAWRDRLDRGLVRLTEIGMGITAADYVRAMNRCHAYWLKMVSQFQGFDILLTPTTPVTPFDVGVDWPKGAGGEKVHPLNYLGFTYPFNLTGLPAASVPCARTGDGLPVGMQIVGRPLEDATVLRVAAAWEEARPWHAAWPPDPV